MSRSTLPLQHPRYQSTFPLPRPFLQNQDYLILFLDFALAIRPNFRILYSTVFALLSIPHSSKSQCQERWDVTYTSSEKDPVVYTDCTLLFFKVMTSDAKQLHRQITWAMKKSKIQPTSKYFASLIAWAWTKKQSRQLANQCGRAQFLKDILGVKAWTKRQSRQHVNQCHNAQYLKDIVGGRARAAHLIASPCISVCFEHVYNLESMRRNVAAYSRSGTM